MTEENFLDVEDQKEVKRIWLVIISVMLVVFLCFLWHGYNSYLKGTEYTVGLLINFGTKRAEIIRRVHG